MAFFSCQTKSLDYGTKVVGWGDTFVAKRWSRGPRDPLSLNSVKEAKDKTGCNAAVIYVPAKFAKEAMRFEDITNDVFH